VSKKTGKPIKPRKPENKKPKKPNRKKKPIKPIKFLKKPAGSVRFRFYKQKTEKTEPNQTETGRFDPVSGFFFKKKKFGLVTFFDKNRAESKMITPSSRPYY